MQTDPELTTLLEQYRALDALVKDSAGQVPKLDWSEFETEVTRRRQSIETPSPRAPVIFKLFTPLATAAAIAITFTLLHNTPPGVEIPQARLETESTVVIARPASAAPRPGDVFVVYGCASGDTQEEMPQSPPVPSLVAMAAVGEHVHWPSLAGVASTQ